MKLRYLLSLLLLFIVALTFAQTDPNLGIIPAPQSIVTKSGYFQITGKTALQYETDADRKIAELFKTLVKDKEGIDLVIAKNFITAPESMISFNSA